MSNLTEIHSIRLDDIVAQLAISAREPITKLIADVTAGIMESRFGKVWDVAELNSAQTRTQVRTEEEIAAELAGRLVKRLLNPYTGV